MRYLALFALSLSVLVVSGCTHPLALDDPYYVSARRTVAVSVGATRGALWAATREGVLAGSCTPPFARDAPACESASSLIEDSDLRGVRAWRAGETKPLLDAPSD